MMSGRTAQAREGRMSIKRVLLRLPVVGPALRYVKRVLCVPFVCDDLTRQVADLHDQTLHRAAAIQDEIRSLPNLWVPVSEQVWEAQAVGAQAMAEDVRTLLDKFRREQSETLAAINRRLEAMEDRMANVADAAMWNE